MPGLVVFKTMAEAVRNGWSVYDRLPNGDTLVKKRTDAGWILALVSSR